jgi:hypothetical protein
MSKIFQCVNSFLSSSLTLTEDCFFDDVVYKQLESLNETLCLQSIESLSNKLSYPCVHYFLNFVNSTQCFQFYYISANRFEAHDCYSFGEELANLFKPNTDVIELTFAFIFLFFFIYYEYKRR